MRMLPIGHWPKALAAAAICIAFDLSACFRNADGEDGPALLRHYAFDAPPRADGYADRAGHGSPLVFDAATKGPQAQQLEIVEGRKAGEKAARLDAGSLSAAPFPVDTNGFTLAMWIRNRGLGTMRGNSGAENGTLFSVGSGYWDGLRLTTDSRTRRIGFEIGQPKPLHSVGISAGPAPIGAWQHVAATWDGAEMRLYVNGLLAAAGRHAAPCAIPPQEARMRVGFSGNGVGSVVLDASEIRIFGNALGAEAIARLAFDESAPSRKTLKQLADAGEAAVAGRHAAAADGFRAALSAGRLAAPVRAAALIGLGEALAHGKRHAEAAKAFVEAIGAAGPTAEAALPALQRLLEQIRIGAAINPSGEILDRLLGMRDLTPDDRVALWRQIAANRCEGDDLPAAREACTAWAEAAGRSNRPSERFDAMMAAGHAALAMNDHAAARAEYAKVAGDESAPAHFRALAQMQTGESFARERRTREAIDALAVVPRLAGTYSHLAEEAADRAREIEAVAGGKPAPGPATQLTLPPIPGPGCLIFVATNGSDTAAGTAAAPFRSLDRARDELRAIRSRSGMPKGGAHVVIGGGEYSITAAFRLAAQDSGTLGTPVVWRAAEGETPRFRGGVRIGGFQKVRETSILDRLPRESRKGVFCADLKAQGLKDLGKFDPGGYASGGGFGTRPVMELYFNGEPMRVSRWPNDGWAQAGEFQGEASKDPHGRPMYPVGRFRCADPRPARWIAETDAFLYGYWFHDWADSYDRVAKIDASDNVITLAPPTHRYGYRPGARFRAVNLLAEIDAPGEYFIDRSAGRLYFLPPSNPAKAVAEVSVTESPLMELDGLSHTTFERLVWELGRGDGIRAKGGQGLLFAGCTVRAFGGDGVVLDGGEGHGLLSCDIAHLGRGGIVLKGGDRRTLNRGNHFVENCHIHHFSRIHPTYTPAIHVSGVGARIRHNRMHDSGSSAMRIEGNEHLAEFNEVFRVVLESDDQGGIDMFGNPSYRGNVYRWNYWHHIGHEFAVGQAGIRLDDAICGTLIYGNVFHRTGGGNFGGVQIHGGKDNIVDNNIFIDCPAAVSFSPWGQKRWLETLDRPDFQNRLAKEVDIAKPPYVTAYPELAMLRENADSNRIWRNIAWNCGQFLSRDRGMNSLADNATTGSDPGFADAARGDWRLKQDAPIFRRTSFRRIPLGEIGLYRDRYRTELPRIKAD